MATIEERLVKLERAVFGAPSPPIPVPPAPPTPPSGNRDDAILAKVRQLRSEGARGSVLAAMLLEYEGVGSRLEPRLSREIPNYRQWLDWRSFGGEHGYPIVVPSAEWDRMTQIRQELRRIPA